MQHNVHSEYTDFFCQLYVYVCMYVFSNLMPHPTHTDPECHYLLTLPQRSCTATLSTLEICPHCVSGYSLGLGIRRCKGSRVGGMSGVGIG